jgi:hypothetical protein
VGWISNRNDDSAGVQHGVRGREDLEHERNEMSDTTYVTDLWVIVSTGSTGAVTGAYTGIYNSAGVTVTSAAITGQAVTATNPYGVSDMVTAAAILPDPPPAAAPGPRKPVPALPPEVWSEREFDADTAHAATLAMCRGNR